MPARWLGFAAFLVALALLAGCGSGTTTSDEASGTQLAVYSSLPLQGPSAATSQQIVNGEKLALRDAGGRAGRYKVGYVSLDDSNQTNGNFSPGVTAANAKTAAQDTSTIAYLGDYDSAATAISLPLINAAGIPQISPWSPYVGLTRALDAGQDEPERFYPSGVRTFARLLPGDTVQAAATVALLRSLGVQRLFVVDDQDPFRTPLASLVAADAEQAGITIAGHDSVSVTTGGSYTGEAEKVLESHAQAMFFSGAGSIGAAQLWQAVHTADPHLLALGSSATLTQAFTEQLGAAETSTYLMSPILAAGGYPPVAQRVLASYRRVFGSEGDGWALAGYEAMKLVLDAVRSAGAHGNDRKTVLEELLATHARASVLGRYSLEADGETTLAHYAVYRVRAGAPVFWRQLDVGK